MRYILCIALGCVVAILPAKSFAWTCICGYTDEQDNPDIDKMFQNFRECHLRTRFHDHLYVPFYHGEGGEIDWWIDVRRKRSALGSFYFKYELVHKRNDPHDGPSVFQVFDVLNYNEQMRAFNEFTFDINWYYKSIISYNRRMLIDKEEDLKKTNWRELIISLEHEIYRDVQHIASLAKDHEYWLQKIRDKQKENERLLLRIYDYCARTHRSGAPQYHKGLVNFYKGNFLLAFENMQERIQSFVARKVEVVVEDTAALLCGMVASEVKDYVSAESCFNWFLEKNSECKEAYFERAITRINLGKLDEAVEDYILSGIHSVLLEGQLQLKNVLQLKNGLQAGFNEMVEADDIDMSLLPNSFVDRVDSKIQRSAEGVQASLDFLREFIQSAAEAAQNYSHEVSDINIPELEDLIQNYDELDDFQKGRLIGGMIKKYGVTTFSKQSSLQAVDVYRNIKNLDSVLKLADLLEATLNSN